AEEPDGRIDTGDQRQRAVRADRGGDYRVAAARAEFHVGDARRALKRGEVAGPVITGSWRAQRVLLRAGRYIALVDCHPGRVRAARREDVKHRDDEFTEPRIQARILELQTGDPAHLPTSRRLMAPDWRMVARRLTRLDVSRHGAKLPLS